MQPRASLVVLQRCGASPLALPLFDSITHRTFDVACVLCACVLRLGKAMYTHNAAYLYPGAPIGAQQQFVLSMDDGGRDPEYGTLIPFAEDAHGRLKACQALAAIEADVAAMTAAKAAAIAANAAAQTFNFHGYAVGGSRPSPTTARR